MNESILECKINNIFKENTNYTNPSQAVNQAASLDALSKDLYADSKRFIYELLQNADDSSINGQPVQVWIKIIDNNLVVAHSGKPFDERDVIGICNINNGTKKSDISKTGYKGIGFKSVFGQSQKVIIFTNHEYFKFDAFYEHEWKWDNTQVNWEQENDREFQYPWQIIPIYIQQQEIDNNIFNYLNSIEANVATIIELQGNHEVLESIKELSQKNNMYLFLKNISNIFFDIEDKATITIDREENGKISLGINNAFQSSWLSRSFEITIPNNMKQDLASDQNIPDKFKNAIQIDLTLCAQIKDNSIVKLSNTEKLLYSYLPTEETNYNLPILVNASFLTTANRESLHTESIWNQWLFEQIGTKLFEWIAELVQSEYQFQAYNLLPDKITPNSLGKAFNEAMDTALETIPFVVTKNGDLIKVRDSIVDFTFLSDKDYVGGESIKKLLNSEDKYFTVNTGFGSTLTKLGAMEFNWKKVSDLLSSRYFQEHHSTNNNIHLIDHLYCLYKQDKFNDLKSEDFKKIPFILDHKNALCIPQQVCFPSADGSNWNDQSTSLSFIHEEIQMWLRGKPEIKTWLESLGVLEKTDITYITQTIIPNIQSYITHSNAIDAIQDLFRLFEKGELKEELIEQLSEIKLLTKKGKLIPANQCHLSDFYSPRFAIEELLGLDIFVSEKYCLDEDDENEWKRFFIKMGVQEKAQVLTCIEKTKSDVFTQYGCESEYFSSEQNRFTPRRQTFTADEFSNIKSIRYLEYSKNSIDFSLVFWKDVLENYLSNDIASDATAFWGRSGMAGRISGDSVTNYIPWYIQNIACIPTTTGNCYSAVDVFLNLPEIKEIGGSYLPIFDGIELKDDWKAFFKFKTEFALEDYLSVLSKVSQDTGSDGTVKETNIKRINLIYKDLLNKCSNWGKDEISAVQEWSKSNQLLNTENKFTACNELKYFLDGNESIFQGQFNFININAENKQHRAIEKFLRCLGIYILKQNEFKLTPTDESYCLELKEHLENILPYFKIWIEQDTNNDIEMLRALEDLQSNTGQLSIKHATELKIQYSEIEFIKDTNTYFNNKTEIYVTKPWDSNSVLMTLPTQLCKFLGLRGHDKKLDFLLRADLEEIQKYFVQENINVPDEILNQYSPHETETKASYIKPPSFDALSTSINRKEISTEYYHMSEADFEKLQYVESIVSRSVENIIEHLKSIHEYDCTNHYEIAKSIIGGIKKHGHEITIVARPSDDNQVLLFYTSEFDVLSHVDAEFWCEDGKNPPRQIRIGQLLTQTGINRIPIKYMNFSTNDIVEGSTIKSHILDFNAIPFEPEKTSRIIASFANTDGGKIIFGLNDSAKIIGLSRDFNVIEIVQKAIAMLSPIPSVNYEWVHVEGKNIFLIEVEKQDEEDILLNDMKYIRNGIESTLEKENINSQVIMNQANIERTFAIIISIENYTERGADTIPPVKYASNDALEFKKILIEKMGVDEDDISFFNDNKALKADLENGLKSLFFQLTENDRLIFYYAGHGFHNGIINCLTTYDTYPSNLLGTTVSLREVLLDPLKSSHCKNALIFIDACAQKLRDDSQRNHISNINEEEIMLIASEFPSYSIFLSCQTGESSYSCDELKHGVWTYHLIQSLSGKIQDAFYKDQHNIITDRSLRDYLSKSVSAYVKNKINQSYNQNPKAIIESSYENVVLELIN